MSKPFPLPTPVRRATILLVAYLLATWLGYRFNLISLTISPVWPATGVAVAGLLLFGPRYAPVLGVGAFIAALFKHHGVVVSLAFAAAVVIESLATAWIYRRAFPRSRRPESANAIATYLLAGMIGPALAATIGAFALATELGVPEKFPRFWLVWWSADVLGIILIGATILAWWRRPFLPRTTARRIEFALMLMGVAVAGWLIFFRTSPATAANFPVTFLAFPAGAWATMRFGQRGSTAASTIFWILAVRGTTAGLGPFAQATVDTTLLQVQAFIAVIAITGLVLGGEFARRRRAERTLIASEARYKTLLEQAPEAICVADSRTGRFVEVNEPALRLFGMTRDELLAVGPVEVSAAQQPGDVPLETAFRAVIDGVLAGEPQEFEWIHLRSDGTPVPCDIRLMRLPGRAPLVRATIVDRTDRPTFAQVTVLESLARGASLDTVLTRLLTLLESQLRGGCGAVMQWDAQAQRFLVICAPSLPADFAESNRTGPYHPGMPFVARTRAGTPQAVADVFEDPDWEGLRPQATQYGYRAVWSWPFNDSNGEKLGLIVMHFAKSRLPTPAQRALLGVAASLAALAIQRDANAASLRQAEEQLREAQKMDAVGRLAGGIAHDFNNLLTVIASASSLLDTRIPADSLAVEELGMIRGATDQAAGLTRQLLAFSRRQPWQTRPLDLNDAIRRLNPMLQRLVGAVNRVVIDLDPSIGHVRADDIQVQQVLINLAVNARDAMPRGGTITVSTRAHVPGRTEVAGAGLPIDRGEWVVLDVEDEGEGFEEGVEEKVFEPFFTTKAAGQGIGLGLATVYGIVRQAGGTIQASNRPSGGARLRVILPTLVTEVAVASSGPEQAAAPEPAAGTRLLLVEDEPTLRRVVARLLRNAGYVVEEAEGVPQAQELLAQSEPFKLVITDVVMPGIGGRELGEMIAARGGPPVLYTSGYTEDTVFLTRIREEGLPFLAKPFTVDELLAAVRPLVPAPRNG